jgi:hypothetical protein
MDRFQNEVSGTVVGLLVTVFVISAYVLVAVVIGGLAFLTVQGYEMYKKRNDPLQLGPWSLPGDTAAFGWDAGLQMGEEKVTWQ